MERNCNSCTKKNECKKIPTMSEDEQNELSCTKYKPMSLYEYVGARQERLRNYLISLAGVERYFV